jgi:hypothetical protein
MDGDKEGALLLIIGECRLEVRVPRGCSLCCTQAVLANKHAHASPGRNVSYVKEVRCVEGGEVVGMTEAEVKAASEQQPLLSFDKWLPIWNPDALFKGSPSRYSGSFWTPGSLKKIAVMMLVGKKRDGRRTGLKAIREEVDAMTHDQLLEIARPHFVAMGE